MHINILALSTIFPNKQKPHHGIFVKNRLLEIIRNAKKNDITLNYDLIAPIPIISKFYFLFHKYIDNNYDLKYLGKDYFNENEVINFDNSRAKFIYKKWPSYPKLNFYLSPIILKNIILNHLAKNKHVNYDLLEGQYLYPEAVTIHEVAKKLNLPYILYARGSDVTNILRNHSLQRKMILKALHNAQKIICVNMNILNELHELHHIEMEKLTFIRNGVNDMFTDQINPMEKEKLRKKYKLGNKVVGIVGHLIDRKNHLELLSALKNIDEKIDVFFIGEKNRDYYKKIKDYISVHKLYKHNIIIIDPLEPKELSLYYNLIDILIIPSKEEGWTNVYLEAAKSGCEIIASDIIAHQEIKKITNIGHLYELGNINQLRNLILTVKKQSSNINIHDFDWQEPSKQAINIYKEIFGYGK